MTKMMFSKKVEPKPVNLDFTIPDFRKDERYISATQKLVELQDQTRQIERQIDSVKKEIRVDSTSERAEKLLRGESTVQSQDRRLAEYHDTLRVTRRAAELQQTAIDNLRLSICGEFGKSPELVQAVTATFRKTGAAMEILFDALIAEQAVLTRLSVVGLAAVFGGLSSGRAEWVNHPILEPLKRSLADHDGPMQTYLRWNKAHFGESTK
jgi:hypothetical protein